MPLSRSPAKITAMEASSRTFERIVVGVDDTPQSIEALHQAQRMLAPGGKLHLLAVADVSVAVHAGYAASRVVDEVQTGARDALAKAMEQSDAVDARLVQGDPTRSLLGEIAREHATLVALGTHGHSRAAGIVLGGTATTLLHEAPCAVLIARPPRGWKRFPSSLAVGIDGSTQSRKALSAALDLAHRLDIPLRRVVAMEGKAVDIEGLRDVAGLEWEEREPLDALLAASQECDVVVVGSRGLHGIAALGSVSERLAHRALSSVLVVR
jgi:nucleotide-binding universal stress UspA family protein